MGEKNVEGGREHLKSRLGFILLSAGCAIGMGNVWKFPWLTGQNGGAIFVIIYIACLVLLGIPIMTMEFAMGRASQKSAVKMYNELEKPGQVWHLHSYLCYAANWVLMMFYSVVTGWILIYVVKEARGAFDGLDADGVGAVFGEMTADPKVQIIALAVVVVLGCVVCSIGVQKGLERVTKYMMIALLGIMVLLAIRSICLKGGSEGIKFYLVPSIENVKEVGVGNVIVNAMNQAFFTLSLGIGSMAVFGSYIGKERALTGEAVRVTVLDTFVAICAGLIIFPACFAYGVEPGAGPGLIFVTLPNIFNHIAGGRIWGTLFFIFMSFAALSTIFTVYENIISMSMELFHQKRSTASIIVGVVMFVLSIPCALGFNVWSGFMPFGEGTGVMDLEDFFVSNLMLPIGALIFVFFCTTRFGWGWKNFLKEANEGEGTKFPSWLKVYCNYILPIIILIIFVLGLYNFFA